MSDTPASPAQETLAPNSLPSFVIVENLEVTGSDETGEAAKAADEMGAESLIIDLVTAVRNPSDSGLSTEQTSSDKDSSRNSEKANLELQEGAVPDAGNEDDEQLDSDGGQDAGLELLVDENMDGQDVEEALPEMHEEQVDSQDAEEALPEMHEEQVDGQDANEAAPEQEPQEWPELKQSSSESRSEIPVQAVVNEQFEEPQEHEEAPGDETPMPELATSNLADQCKTTPGEEAESAEEDQKVTDEEPEAEDEQAPDVEDSVGTDDLFFDLVQAASNSAEQYIATPELNEEEPISEQHYPAISEAEPDADEQNQLTPAEEEPKAEDQELKTQQRDQETVVEVEEPKLEQQQQAPFAEEPKSEEHQTATTAAEAEHDTPEQYMDILGNGQLMKKTLQNGRGEETRPKTGFRVTVNFEARLGSLDGAVVDRQDGLTLTIGDYDFLQAFDIALMVTQMGERCEIRSGPRHAYGSKQPFTTQLGCEIPPDSTLSFVVDLVNVEDPLDLSTVSLDDLLAISDAKRERGNFWFNRDEHYTAVCCYARAAGLLEQRCSSDLSGASNSAVQAALDARVRVYNNLAACQLKLESWDAAIESCDKALRLQAGNAKALYRKGRALVGKGDQAAALQAMRAALAEEPDSRALQNEVAKLTLECRRQQTASQDLYRRMMGVSKSPEAASSASAEPSTAAAAAAAGAASSTFIGRYKFWLVGALGSLVVSALLAGAAYRNNR